MSVAIVRTIDKPRMQHMDEHMNNHSYVWTKKTTVSWTMVTPCGGVTVIYRGLYEMFVGGY